MSALVAITGQSNALGYQVTASEFPAAMLAENPLVKIWDASTQTFVNMKPGINTGTVANPGAIGPEAAFAYQWSLTHPGETLYIVKVVKGSTGIAQDASEVDWSPASSGELFDQATTEINAAKAATGLALSGILWMQGEQDAASSLKAGAYQGNWSDLMGEMRSAWGDVGTPIIYGRISDSAGLAYDDAVRLAQDNVDGLDGNAVAINTDGFPMQADLLHYSGAGQISLGQAMFEAYENSPRTITGSTGNDALYGGAGGDTISGGDGNDLIMGGAGNDWLHGNKGSDTVQGGQGNDTVYGGQQNDAILGGQGNDMLYADAGDDLLFGNKGNDTMNGGAGNDSFFVSAGGGSDLVTDFTYGQDNIVIEDHSAYSVSYSGADTVVTLADSTSITLAGVHLTGTDWIIS